MAETVSNGREVKAYRKKKHRIGVIVVLFDEETKQPYAEGEEEMSAPAWPFFHEREFRDLCLRAFIKAGGSNLHQ